MHPVETSAAPRSRRLHPLAAHTLLWVALALLVVVQFLDWPGGRVGVNWRVLADSLIATRYAGWTAFDLPWEWIGTFVLAHVSIAAAPWLALALVRHRLLLWLARLFSVAACGGLLWCVLSDDPASYLDYTIAIWAGCLMLPSVLSTAGLCLLPWKQSDPHASHPAMPPPGPLLDHSLRLRLARIFLWAALVFLLVAQPLPWTKDIPIWFLFRSLGEWAMKMVVGTPTAGGWMGFAALILSVSFLALVCPWFARILSANAPLRWICRVCSIGACLVIISGSGPVGRMDLRIVPGVRVLMAVSVLNAIGLCLLPGRKTAAPFIPSGNEPS